MLATLRRKLQPRTHLRRAKEAALRTLFPKQYNKRTCADPDLWQWYYDHSEGDVMEREWNDTIWPIIKDFEFTSVLELAAGAGRNTQRLLSLATTLYAVDINQLAIERLQRRFRDYAGPCALRICQNDGTTLPMVPSDSISLVYCWDSAVHFDRRIIRDYIREFARVMRAGAKGFIQHSDLGDAANPDFRLNPQYRSNMNRDLFRQYCAENGLAVVAQYDLPWGAPDHPNGRVTDCISVFTRPERTSI
jgi:SAM-dependent methyltransferase